MRVSRTGSSRLRLIAPERSDGRNRPAKNARHSSRLTLRERALRQAEDRARDHEALDLARPLVDLGDLRVSVVALDRKLLRVAVAAENLDRLGRLPPGHLRGEQLRLGPGLG